MTQLDRNSFHNRCGAVAREFHRFAEGAVCRTSAEMSEAYVAFSMRMIDGVVFRTNSEITKASLDLSEAVVEFLGSDYASILEIQSLAFKIFAECFAFNSDFSYDYYEKKFLDSMNNYIERSYSYVGPCNLFQLEEGVSGLRSKYVSLVKTEEFLDKSSIAKGGKNWILKEGKKFSNLIEEGNFQVEIGGLCWHIETCCAKDIAREKARWMAEIFTSLVRLGIKPASYCHRAKYGDIEPNIFAEASFSSNDIVYNTLEISTGGKFVRPFYKVDDRFACEFHSREFQNKVDQIFEPEKRTLGKRTSDGLGWLTRGRQSRDMSERLLFFFTSIEALLSDNDQFSPVSDTIARMVSVILSKAPKYREGVYDEMKKLYSLRSDLVHRGDRSAHLLNANKVQHFAEYCFHVIINTIDLSCPHKEFLQDLRHATHGGHWPT